MRFVTAVAVLAMTGCGMARDEAPRAGVWCTASVTEPVATKGATAPAACDGFCEMTVPARCYCENLTACPDGWTR